MGDKILSKNEKDDFFFLNYLRININIFFFFSVNCDYKWIIQMAYDRQILLYICICIYLVFDERHRWIIAGRCPRKHNCVSIIYYIRQMTPLSLPLGSFVRLCSLFIACMYIHSWKDGGKGRDAIFIVCIIVRHAYLKTKERKK